jgi:hypothetical protein
VGLLDGAPVHVGTAEDRHRLSGLICHKHNGVCHRLLADSPDFTAVVTRAGETVAVALAGEVKTLTTDASREAAASYVTRHGLLVFEELVIGATAAAPKPFTALARGALS